MKSQPSHTNPVVPQMSARHRKSVVEDSAATKSVHLAPETLETIRDQLRHLGWVMCVIGGCVGAILLWVAFFQASQVFWAALVAGGVAGTGRLLVYALYRTEPDLGRAVGRPGSPRESSDFSEYFSTTWDRSAPADRHYAGSGYVGGAHGSGTADGRGRGGGGGDVRPAGWSGGGGGYGGWDGGGGGFDGWDGGGGGFDGGGGGD